MEQAEKIKLAEKQKSIIAFRNKTRMQDKSIHKLIIREAVIYLN